MSMRFKLLNMDNQFTKALHRPETSSGGNCFVTSIRTIWLQKVNSRPCIRLGCNSIIRDLNIILFRENWGKKAALFLWE